MLGKLTDLRLRFFPPVPVDIRDDFALLRAHRIETLTPALFFTLMATTPTAIYGGEPSVHVAIRVGLPIALALIWMLGLLNLLQTRKRAMTVRRANRIIRDATWYSGSIGILCSFWTVTNWFAAPAENHSYYAMIMAMGSLATAYCLASIRLATVVNLLVGLTPIALLMLTSGRAPEVAAGTSLVMATAFLMRMIFQQHGQLIDLLQLQSQMRDQALTDPLTGLANRRALDARVEQAIAGGAADRTFAVALLDLDGFKPVNDRFGHAVGDQLLCAVAARLRAASGSDAMVARQGGDEFAILVPAGSPLLEGALDSYFLAALAAPYHIDKQYIAVGASIGIAHWPTDGALPKQLFETADRALYAAKALDREGAPSLESRIAAA